MTRDDCKTVLVIAHTITSAQRLLDAVRLLEPDPRVQVVFTTAPDMLNGGLEELLAANGGVVTPWQQATQLEFDLALAASYGAVHKVHAPLIVMPHEASFSQMVQRARRAVGGGIVYGLDPQRLIRGGRPVPSAILLSHDAEIARLAHAHPEALSIASVIGDSSHDRLVASMPLRDFYRRALGVCPGQKLVVMASTGSGRARSRQRHEVLRRVLAELPTDEYRVLALFHPDVRSCSRRTGLAGCLRQRLSLMPPEADWRTPLVAADWIISDHEAVAPYGAITGVPVVLFGPPNEDFDSSSSLAELAKVAPRLTSRHSIRAQLRRVAKKHRPDRYQPVIERITSEPGRFNRNMRSLMYRILGLRQPTTIPTTDPVSPPFRIE